MSFEFYWYQEVRTPAVLQAWGTVRKEWINCAGAAGEFFYCNSKLVPVYAAPVAVMIDPGKPVAFEE